MSEDTHNMMTKNGAPFFFALKVMKQLIMVIAMFIGSNGFVVRIDI